MSKNVGENKIEEERRKSQNGEKGRREEDKRKKWEEEEQKGGEEKRTRLGVPRRGEREKGLGWVRSRRGWVKREI